MTITREQIEECRYEFRRHYNADITDAIIAQQGSGAK